MKQLLVCFGPFFWALSFIGPLRIGHYQVLEIRLKIVFLNRKRHLSYRHQGIVGSWHRLWISDIQGQHSVSFLFLFPLSNFILIIKNTADHTEWLLAERQSVPEGPVVGHRVYDDHKTRARSEHGLPEWQVFCLQDLPSTDCFGYLFWFDFFVLFCFLMHVWVCMCAHI